MAQPINPAAMGPFTAVGANACDLAAAVDNLSTSKRRTRWMPRL
jgi:hypothetical protein